MTRMSPPFPKEIPILVLAPTALNASFNVRSYPPYPTGDSRQGPSNGDGPRPFLAMVEASDSFPLHGRSHVLSQGQPSRIWRWRWLLRFHEGRRPTEISQRCLGRRP